eukprot:4728727-Pleurochrysis_carterae.AAC.1
MRPTSLRALAAIANSAGMRMRRWDFVAAYLQGDLEQNEVVYCESCAAGIRHHRLRWTPSHMSRREADLRDGPSRPAVAAHALPVATRIRPHSMQIRSMRLHHDQIHRRRTAKAYPGLLRGRPIHFVYA